MRHLWLPIGGYILLSNDVYWTGSPNRTVRPSRAESRAASSIFTTLSAFSTDHRLPGATVSSPRTTAAKYANGSLRRAGAAGRLSVCSWLSTRIRTRIRSEEHTSELQSRPQLVCRLL